MRTLHIAAAMLLSVGLIASSDLVSAQDKKKKVTRQEAWSLCTAEVSKIPGDQHSQRYAAGAACMKKYGYKI
jgi:hypothetical protein